MSTAAKALLQPILDGGVRHANFVNGALLTGEALRAEQQANHDHVGRLGRATGAGVAYGLSVQSDPTSTATQPLVRVLSGLAVSRRGWVLELQSDVQLRLLCADQEVAHGGGFVDCGLDQTEELPAGTGVYVLAIAAAGGHEGSVPMHGLQDNGRVHQCTRQYVVDGLQFRLVRLDTSGVVSVDLAPNNEAKLSKLRNALTHHCVGTDRVAGFATDPLRREDQRSAYARRGALDALRSTGALTDCDVPLALIFWSNQGIRFVDPWSVRRRLVRPAATELWPLILDDRTRADSEAIFHQFQDQIDDLTRPSRSLDAMASTRAVDFFRFLPPAGIVPIATPRRPAGLNVERFFEGLSTRGPTFLEGPLLRGMLRSALDQPPVLVESGELLHLFAVRENVQAVDADGPDAPTRFVAFARAGAEVETLARYDHSYFDHADFV